MKSRCIRAKSHDEWLKNRRGGIGSSDVAAVLGLSPFCSPYQLWLAKRDDSQQEEQQENEVMLLGHLLEDAIAQRWAIATGKEIIKSSAGEWVFIHPQKDFLRASPDRLYWDDSSNRRESNKCILEIKSTQKPIDPENIPMHWFIQVQHQMYVMGIAKANLAWLTQGRDFGYVEILRNDDFCQTMEAEVERFWIENIIGGEEPALISASDVLAKYHTEIAGKTAEAGEDIYTAYNELKAIRDEISALDERKTQLEEKLKLAIDDAEAISYQGQTLATWKTSKERQKFDAAAFKAEHPELYGQFIRKESGSRIFRLK